MESEYSPVDFHPPVSPVVRVRALELGYLSPGAGEKERVCVPDHEPGTGVGVEVTPPFDCDDVDTCPPSNVSIPHR